MANKQFRVRLSAEEKAYLNSFNGTPSTAIKMLIREHKRLDQFWKNAYLSPNEYQARPNESQTASEGTQPDDGNDQLAANILASLDVF